jgi:hypothetical protein
VTFVEQRQSERSHVWLAIRLSTGGGDAFAVTYDVSDRGVLILAPRTLSIGTQVTLTLEVPSSPPRTLVATGRVVHEEPNTADPEGLWPFRAGVALDEVMGEFRTVIEGLVRANPFASPR